MSCKTHKYDLFGREGDNKMPIAFRFTVAGQAVDISEFGFHIELRHPYRAAIRYRLGDGLSIVGDELVWEFGRELTIKSGTYDYAIKIVENGRPRTIIEGKFNVKPEKVAHV